MELLLLTNYFQEVHIFTYKVLGISVPTSTHKYFDQIIIPRLHWNRHTFFYSFFRTKNLIIGHHLWNFRLFNYIKRRPPSGTRHELFNNFSLIDAVPSKSDWENVINWKISKTKIENQIVIHPIAEYGKARFKNILDDQWIAIIKFFSHFFPNYDFKIVGLKDEISFLSGIDLGSNVKVQFFDDKMEDWVSSILCSSKCISPDTGALHIAALSGIPTFSFWGGSSPTLAGYSQFDRKHVELHKPLECAPCYSYVDPNRSRVNNANLCPDFACVRQYDTKLLINSMVQFLSE